MVFIQQNAPADQTFTFPNIPNLSITVYAGTIFTLEGGSQPNPFPLTAVEIATDRLPGGTMPDDLQGVVPFLVGFQPANTSVNQPVPVFFPNVLNSPPGTEVPLVTLDSTQGIMVNYGTGTVSTNGGQIIPDFDPNNPAKRFGLLHLGWHAPQPPPNPDDPSPDSNAPECGDPIDLSSCIFVLRETDLAMTGGRGRIGVERQYRSLSLTQGPFGIGTSHNYTYRLSTNNPQSSTVINLIMPEGNRFPFVRQADGTFINVTIPAVRGAVLSVLANNEVNLRWKDGTIFHFFPVSFALGSTLDSITDRNGNQTLLVRNLSDPVQILEIIDPVGRKLTLGYDQADRILTISDPIGREVRYTYNGQGTLETVTNPEGGVTRYDYDTQNRLIQITDARGIVVAQNTYDATGRVIEQIQANGGVWTFEYELLNPLVALSPTQSTKVTDPRGNLTTYRFNPQGFLISVTDPLGQTLESEIENGTNLLLSITDSLGRTTRFTYDAQGNRTSIQDPAGNVTTFEYGTPFNLLTKTIDALGQETTREYDAQGNLVTITNPMNESVTISYNQFGQPTEIMDALGNTMTFTYDAQGNRSEVIDGLGNPWKQNYDGIGRPIEIIDPRGPSTRLDYLNLNQTRVKRITDARNGVTVFGYDPNGNVLSLTDAEGHEAAYSYNSMDQRITWTDPLGRVESNETDAHENVIKVTNRRGEETLFDYDALDRQTKITYQDGSTTEVSYDAVGRDIHVVDSIAGTIVFQYEQDRNLLLQEMTPEGVVSYAYDALSRRTSMTINNQDPVMYSYDAASRLIQVSQGSEVVELTYDMAGRKTRIDYANGTSVNYLYDAGSRLVTISHDGPSEVIDAISYTYDTIGNRTGVNRLNGAATILPSETQAQYDVANQQIQLNDTVPNAVFDQNGNLQAQTVGGITTTYTWDSRDRLVGINAPGNVASFLYDYLNRRRQKTINGVTTSYHYDGKDIVSEIQEGNVVVRYLRSLNLDDPFIRIGGEKTYYHLDALGSTMALTDSLGAVTTTYNYAPFGTTSSTGSSSNHLQYTGREHDDTGLYYYRARYYSPQSARFISEDPLLNSKAWAVAGNSPPRVRIGKRLPKTGNAYRYVDNNPLRYVDPLGLQKDHRCGGQCAAEVGGSVGQCAGQAMASPACTVACVGVLTVGGAIGGGLTGIGPVGG